MATKFPECFKQLDATTTTLERHLKDMQDCEFTVQDNRLFMLQTRTGKRTGSAALRVAVEMEVRGGATPFHRLFITCVRCIVLCGPQQLDTENIICWE